MTECLDMSTQIKLKITLLTQFFSTNKQLFTYFFFMPRLILVIVVSGSLKTLTEQNEKLLLLVRFDRPSRAHEWHNQGMALVLHNTTLFFSFVQLRYEISEKN